MEKVKLTKVKNDESYARDPRSNAVVNIDNNALATYKARRQMRAHVDEINKLKDDMKEIKNLLTKLVKDN